MYFKFSILVITTLFVYSHAVTYNEIVGTCKTKFNQQDDGPLDYFLGHGSFPAGYENLKCFFNCIATSVNAVDAQGALIKERLGKVPTEYPDGKQELELFTADAAIQACYAKHQEFSDPCDKTYQYAKCSIGLKLASQ